MLDHDVKSIAQILLEAGQPSTQVAAGVQRALAQNNLGILSEISVDPSSYSDSEAYFRDAQVAGFLKKYYDPAVPQEALEQAARKTWIACEHQCFATNLRFADFIYNTAYRDGKDERLWCFIQKCKELARQWLGRVPDWLVPRFGPGATFSDRGHRTTIMDKMSSRPTLTADAYDVCVPCWAMTAWFRALAREYPNSTDPCVVEGNRYTTVPKDCRKRRSIGVEPSLNVTLQLAVGKVIRKRLSQIGIDLDHGQDRHRDVARMGSLSGLTNEYMRQDIATLDLSSASDTISTNLVRAILPPMWFDLLSALRSPKTCVDGKWYCLEKFSSMGNGFTFELETLIFLILLTAMSEGELIPGKNLLVYGDDIIIPSKWRASAVRVLEWAGFSINMEKSYWSGPFRESCGGDYFLGRAVRPLFLKEAPSRPTDWIALANGFYRTAVNTYWSGDWELCEETPTATVLGWLQPAWAYCLSRIPNRYRRCRGPHDLGDVVITDCKDRWSTRWRNGIRYFEAVVDKSRRRSLKKYPGSVVLAALVYGVPASGVAPRGAPKTTLPAWVPFS